MNLTSTESESELLSSDALWLKAGLGRGVGLWLKVGPGVEPRVEPWVCAGGAGVSLSTGCGESAAGATDAAARVHRNPANSAVRSTLARRQTWRERVGIEPTPDTRAPGKGFEVLGAHQNSCVPTKPRPLPFAHHRRKMTKLWSNP